MAIAFSLLPLTMNYLAHAYLSFNDPQILAGNLISDFVKGKKQFDYSPEILTGIKLHRAIDNFTDTHPVIKEMKVPFVRHYRLYAGAFTDIVCDYFLANDRKEFNSVEDLTTFCSNTYHQLDLQYDALPLNFQQMFVYMKQYNWLNNYQYDWAIQRSFAGMGKRAKYINETDTAFSIFENNKEKMKTCYKEFFPLLKNYSFQTWKQIASEV